MRALLCCCAALLLAAACGEGAESPRGTERPSLAGGPAAGEARPPTRNPPRIGRPKVAERLAAGEQLHIVAYGTSLTEFGAWVPELRRTLDERFPGRATVTNRGRHGVGTRWGLEHLDERVIAEKPDVVLVEFAINDAFETLGVAPRESRALLEQMVGRVEAALPECEIVLMTTNPTTAGYPRRDLAPYYQAVRDVASQRGLLLVDAEPAWRQLLEKDRAAFDAWVPDGIHPSPRGDAAIMTPRVLTALGL